MRKLVLSVVGGEDDEWHRILLLLGIGFFAGIFVATYSVSVKTIFLNHFDEETYLPYSFTASGLLGVISTYIFTYFQSKGFYKTLVFYTLLIFTIFVSFISVGLNYYQNEYVIFFAYVFMVPVNSIVILCFWGVFGRLFDYSAAKRLSGGIDTGQAISAILAFFILPFFINLVHRTPFFLFISAICMVFMLILFVLIFREYDMVTISKSRKTESKVSTMGPWYKNSYVIFLALFVTMSLAAARFVDYSFLTVTAQYFANNEKHLSSYLSFFDGTVMICSFLVQTFLNDKILEMFGLKISLMILPVILLGFTIIATFVGHLFGITSASPAFILFFIVISISKLFVDALRDSLENPTVKIFFFPLDVSIRFDIQTKIEGVIKEFSTLLVGGILILLGNINYFNVLFSGYVLFLVIFIWLYVVIMMYQEYQKVLVLTLESQKPTAARLEEAGKNDLSKRLTRELRRGNKFAEVKILGFLQRVDFFVWLKQISRLNTIFTQDGLIYSLSAAQEWLVLETLPVCKHMIDHEEVHPVVLKKINETIELLESAQSDANDLEKLYYLSVSRNTFDRKRAALLLGYNKDPKAKQILLPLLKDMKDDVRKAAIISAGKLKENAFLPLIIDHFTRRGFENIAFSAILHFGKKVLPTLETYFHKNGQTQKAMQTIIKLYGRMPVQKAVELLEVKIDITDKRIFQEVLAALSNAEWRVPKNESVFLKTALDIEVETTVWNIAAITELDRSPSTILLKEALKEEIKLNFEHVYLILSLLYEKESVMLVRQNMEAGTPDSIGYALELLNIFLDEELKTKIIPLFENISPSEKVKRFEVHFPREPLPSREVVLRILGRDYTAVNRWTRTVALIAFFQRDDVALEPDLIAHLFNADPLLRETAAWIICQIDLDEYYATLSRVPRAYAMELNQVVLLAINRKNISKNLLRYQKVLFLKQVKLFRDTPFYILSELVELVEYQNYEKGERIPFSKSISSNNTLIVVEGELELFKDGVAVTKFKKRSVVSELISNQLFDSDFDWSIKASRKGYLFRFHNDELYEKCIAHQELFENVFSRVKETI